MKKLATLFLVFSILILTGNMFAKERKGAYLVIQKRDGHYGIGELIALKEESLLLLERDSGADVSVKIKDIRIITIRKKSYLLESSVIGLLAGAGIGAVIGNSQEEHGSLMEGVPTAVGLYAGAATGLVIGLVTGLSRGGDKTFQIEGESDSEIQEILEKLRKKARVPNFQ